MAHRRCRREGEGFFARSWLVALSIGLACGFFASGLVGSLASPVQAQSLKQIYNQTKRGISKTIRNTQSVIDGNSTRTSRRGRSRNVQAEIIIPPLPERKPRPWAKKRPVPRASVTTNSKAQTPGTARQEVRASPRKAVAKKAPSLTRGKKRAGAKSKHQHRNSAKSARTASKSAAAAAKDKGNGKDTAKKEEPDIFTEVEINIAKARCRHLLKQVDAVTIAHDPIKKGPCGNAAPVKLVSIGTKPQVSISPPPVVNCDMVVALHKWLERDLQPMARKHLGSPIVRIRNMSSYSCRNAYGRRDTRLSEHAKANALDIGSFVTAKAQTADLLKHWGPTQRDVAKRLAEKKAKAAAEAKKRKAEQVAEAAKKKAAAANSKATVRKISVRTTIHDGLPEDGSADTTAIAPKGSKPSKLGARPPVPTAKSKLKVAAIKPEPPFKPTGRSRFLRAVHKRACKIFGTVLGPESNDAHRNHFHVDLAPRKRRNFCE